MNLYKYVSDAINKKLGFEAKLDVPKNRDFGDLPQTPQWLAQKWQAKIHAIWQMNMFQC